MALERTLSIVKPDAVAKNIIGEIYSRFEKGGLKIVAARMQRLSRAKAEGFYAEHRGRPFFESLVTYMMSGPVVIQVLEGDNAIAVNRKLMGATNPKDADPGRSAPTSPNRSTRMRCTDPIRRKPRRARSATSSAPTRSIREAE